MMNESQDGAPVRDAPPLGATAPVPGSGLRALLTRRLVGALRFSLAGLGRGWSEEAFRVEVVLATVLIPLGFWLGSSPVERILMVGSVVFVMIVELLNTAVEVAIDRISTDRHPLSKHAKDLGSAAVLLAMLLVPLTWGLILFGR